MQSVVLPEVTLGREMEKMCEKERRRRRRGTTAKIDAVRSLARPMLSMVTAFSDEKVGGREH